MASSETTTTVAIGLAGVGAAALADAVGAPTIWSSLLGLTLVVVLIAIRRRWRGRS